MIIDRIQTSFRWRFLSPATPKIQSSGGELITLGSKYGRKTYLEGYVSSPNPILISAGVGEDISFDLEFQALNDAYIILVDPTPTAIKHFKDVRNGDNNEKKAPYSNSSRQKPENYSLQKVDFNKITYVPKAVWSEITKISFFQPVDPIRDGSFSIKSIDAYYRKNTSCIEVTTTTISELVKQYELQLVDILKLDVEGAALETLRACFKSHIFPKQLLIEVDEIHFPCLKSKLRAHQLFKLIKKAGYIPIHRDNCDFLFVRLSNYE